MKPTYNLPLIREDMALKGWLQNDVAKAAGLTENTISQFLRGYNTSPRTAKKIARALRHSLRRYLISNVTPAERRTA